jgi:hypothetical protein
MALGLRELKGERTRTLVVAKRLSCSRPGVRPHGYRVVAEVGSRYFPAKQAPVVTFVEAHLTASLKRLRVEPGDIPLASALYVFVEAVNARTTVCADHVLPVYDLASRTPSVPAGLSRVWASGGRRARWRCADAAISEPPRTARPPDRGHRGDGRQRHLRDPGGKVPFAQIR